MEENEKSANIIITDAEKAREQERKDVTQHLLGLTRKAVQDYNLINEGDVVCVGVSGGKDSLALLTLLASLKRFYPKKFELRALSVAMGFEGMDFSRVAEYCRKIRVPYDVEETQIREIVFDIRKEKNPCALCANLRRGALNDNAAKMGANVVALGHHRDDVIETAFLSLSYEGRFYCFSPKTYLERSRVTVIRPMLYVNEYELRKFGELSDLPVVKNPCPMDQTSKRADIKRTLDALNRENHIFRDNVFGAVKRGIWDKEEAES